MRLKKAIISSDNKITRQIGSISALNTGFNPYQLSVGTELGYLSLYDLRVGLATTLYASTINAPVEAVCCIER